LIDYYLVKGNQAAPYDVQVDIPARESVGSFDEDEPKPPPQHSPPPVRTVEGIFVLISFLFEKTVKSNLKIRGTLSITTKSRFYFILRHSNHFLSQ
jgi:hypothetical protein